MTDEKLRRLGSPLLLTLSPELQAKAVFRNISGTGVVLEEFPEYITFEQHVTDWVLVNLFILLPCYLLARHLRRGKPRLPEEDAELRKRGLNWWDYFVGSMLVLTVGANFFYKLWQGPLYLALLLFPCHTLSCLTIYALFLSPSLRRASHLFNLLSFFSQFVLLAVLYPDDTDLVYFAQVYSYWVQHIVLVSAPISLLLNGTYNLPKRRVIIWIDAIFWGWFWMFNVDSPVSLLTGANVTYCLWPPAPLLEGHWLSGRWFKFKLGFLTTAMSIATAFIFIWIAVYLKSLFTSKSKKKQ